MKHFKSLDALRGLAVLAVMAHHASYLSAGWAGVQLFFVLSGFLITGILLRVKETGANFKTYLLRFFWRRTVRIWPLYFLYVGLFALLVSLSLVKLTGSGRFWFYITTFTFNLSGLHPHYALGQLWTLSVEEQFYVAWPFLVYLLSRRGFQRLALGIVLLGPLVRLGAGLIYETWPRTDPTPLVVYGLTTSHLDAFAVGALLCVLPRSWSEWLKTRINAILPLQLGITALAGLLMLIATRAHSIDDWLSLGYAFTLPSFHQYVWGYTLLNLSSAALIFYLVHNVRTPRFFENRALVYIGKISYGIYIWHVILLYGMWRVWPDWPIHRATPKALLLVVLYTALTVGVASASYFGFEQFFLRLKDMVAPETKRPSPPLEATP